MRVIAPSVLAADFGNLERDIRMLERSRAEWIHIDVMDGVFVPNISFGFPVIEAIDHISHKYMDVHLMITDPVRYVERFRRAGADCITFHVEAAKDSRAVIDAIRHSGAEVGMSLRPVTPVEALEEYLPLLDMVLVMSVEPGFGGQKFMEESVERVAAIRQMAERLSPALRIEVDGGIGAGNARRLFDAGAQVLVAGSSVFGAADPERAIVEMLEV